MTDAPAPPTRRRRWILALRALGLVVLVVVIVRSAGTLEEAKSALARVRAVDFAACLGVSLLSLFCIAVRTRILLSALGARARTTGLFVDVLVATAMNALFLMGMDLLYRAVRLRPVAGSVERASFVVLMDRGLGLATQFAAAVLLFAFLGRTPWSTSLHPNAAWLLGAGGAALVAVIAFVALRRFAPAMARLRGAVEAARTLLRSPLALAGAILSSVGSYVGSVFVVWMLGNALGLSVDGSVYFYAVPMVAIATLLPISLGGIGVRELGYFALLASEGVSRGEATALGVCQYTVFLLISAVAGIVWTAGVDRFPVEA